MGAAEESSLPFLVKHEFLVRRLHSLSGLIPVGAFMTVHLLVNASVVLLDAGIFYRGFLTFIESVEGVRILLNLGSLLLKASFITMQQPLFWGGVLITVSLIGLWVWLMRGLLRRAVAPVELLS